MGDPLFRGRLVDAPFAVIDTLSPPIAAAPPRRQLLAATTVVIALHAVLLTGLPDWSRSIRPGEQGTAFETRLIAPPAPTPAPASPPAAAPTPPVVAAPPPNPRAERARPRTLPRPARAQPAEPPAPAPEATDSPSVEPTPDTPSPTSSTQASSSATAEPSLIGPRPPGSFGGGSAPQAITPPLAAAEATAALQWAASAGDAPTVVPPAASVSYRTAVNIGGQADNLTTTLNWRHDGRQYDARWALYGPRFGDHSRTSTGLLAPQGLVPVEAALRTTDAQTVRFDYAAEQLRFASGSAPLRAGTQDRLSVLLQLGALLAGDVARYPVGSHIELPAAHARGPGSWRFEIEAEDRLVAFKGQELPTLRLVHTPQDAADARIEVWLSRGVHYLPVRVRITEANGDTVEHTMQSAYTQQVPGASTLTR